MIEKCNSRGLQFKVRDLSATPFQYQFVVERILEVKPILNPFLPDNHVVEEREVLFSFTKANKKFSRRELFRLINWIYSVLDKNYQDWVYPESDSDIIE